MSKQAEEVLEKTAYEVKYYVFNFADEMETGETITSQSVTCSPSGLTIATPVGINQYVQVKLSGGTAGTAYLLKCRITTNVGETIDGSGRLVVTED